MTNRPCAHGWSNERTCEHCVDEQTMNSVFETDPVIEELQSENKQLRSALALAEEALEWVVECEPDLYGDADPERGAPLTPVAKALARIHELTGGRDG